MSTPRGPQRFGRYSLVYPLGEGGMASVHLARTVGAGGFQQWFAVKRIHPHLAKDEKFVHMFLDEARIAATLRHPNVAQVLDLGVEGGEHYLAMEYLHGEHLGTIAVRTIRESGRIPYGLAAYIVARAADGLHHAHEACDAEGDPLELVHRDVSPQNIFVTFDGTVRITDFGIARAAGRLTHTETGDTKGKVAYMAPEQAHGRAIDRRADVFALGIVLWEITVGRRLFKADNPLQTMMRITSGEVPPPTELVADYPPALSQIVMRALALEPEDRHPTAAVMARELDRFTASLGVPLGTAELAAFVEHVCADRKEAKDHLLVSQPATLMDFRLPDVTAGEDSSASGGIPRRSDDPRLSLPPRRRIGPTALSLGALALAAMLALGAALAVRFAPDRAPREAEVAAPARASARIESTPSGAEVRVDGRLAGTAPVLVPDLSVGRHRIAMTLADHEPLTATFDAVEGETRLAYVLRHAPADPPRAPLAAPAAEPRRPRSRLIRIPPPPPPPTPRAHHGFLTLRTIPATQVRIGGRSYGTTPLVRERFAPGELAVSLRTPSGLWRMVVVHVRAGATTSRTIDLR